MNKLLFFLIYILICSLNAGAKKAILPKPNIVIIIGDDCTFTDLPLYGGENINTPSIDKLASQGLTFNRAFLSMAMCAPCRAELFTGLQPINNGVCWNHSRARVGTKSIVQMLSKYGYRTGIAGKRHLEPKKVFPFEVIEGLDSICVLKTSNYDSEGIKKFMTHSSTQPFCLIVGLVTPHSPWTVGNHEKFNRENLHLPPYLANTPKTRDMYAKYLAEIEVMDSQVGMTIDLLGELNLDNNTIVIFTSEQGAQFPFCKWTNYNNGVQTGFVVKWPEVTRPGTHTNAMIQYCDLLPTILDFFGDTTNYNLDGKSFLPVLKYEKDFHREYAYSIHNNIPEGSPYPIRSITDGHFRYIRNLKYEYLYVQRYIMGWADTEYYWNSWMNNSVNDNTTSLIKRYMQRPPEELYDLIEDPHNMNNLAKLNEYVSIKNKLSKELDRWMENIGDPGSNIDSYDEWSKANKDNHFNKAK